MSLLFATAAPAATQIVQGGKLVGATGVTVSGTLYDVRFGDGSCESLFDGCTSTANFAFTTLASARAAGSALLSQVFLDTPAGNFDTLPGLTEGCIDPAECVVFIPYDLVAGVVPFVPVQNASIENLDRIEQVGGNIPANVSTGPLVNATYARFQLAAIPEPGTWALMIAGFGGVGAAARRRRAVAKAQLA